VRGHILSRKVITAMARKNETPPRGYGGLEKEVQGEGKIIKLPRPPKQLFLRMKYFHTRPPKKRELKLGVNISIKREYTGAGGGGKANLLRRKKITFPI